MGIAVYSLLVFIFLKTSFVQPQCTVPPQFWCDDPHISASCGVLDQCKTYLRSSMDKPVDFTLYYESLCPDCKRFFKEQFYPAYQAVGGIMNITLVPYGNAQEHFDGKHWIFQCQHGKEECIGNLIETCAINMIKNNSICLPFIHCMEMSSELPVAAAKQCASNYDIDVSSILECYMSESGNKLEHQMAVKTEALRPKHEYVPWVTINGVHTEKMEKLAESDLVKLICMSYTGSSPPPACSK